MTPEDRETFLDRPPGGVRVDSDNGAAIRALNLSRLAALDEASAHEYKAHEAREAAAFAEGKVARRKDVAEQLARTIKSLGGKVVEWQPPERRGDVQRYIDAKMASPEAPPVPTVEAAPLTEIEALWSRDPAGVRAALKEGRRWVRTDLFTPTETKLRDALIAVEALGADTLLSEATTALLTAQRCVGRYIDDTLGRMGA